MFCLKRSALLFFLLVFPVLAFLTPVPSSASAKLNKTSISITEKKTFQLKVKGTKKKISWSSGNSLIATVTKKGKVKGIKKGTCKIYARFGKKKLTCKVRVKAQKSSSTETTKQEQEETNPSAEEPLGRWCGKRTLKSYLANALVPCGRTLYIYGGGWGDEDSSVIGYQAGWARFFKAHATPDYDNSKYRFKYGCGLDCSGFAAWTLYNTLYTKAHKKDLRCSSTKTAAWYASKGWADLAKNTSDKTFRPGDVVSRSGHVWICLGQYSDGSVLLVHSTLKGVQINGTSGKAATAARHYMKKYFPAWPYAVKAKSSGYLKYVGKARFKVTGEGSILTDPEGVQKMSADQVMKMLLGN